MGFGVGYGLCPEVGLGLGFGVLWFSLGCFGAEYGSRLLESNKFLALGFGVGYGLCREVGLGLGFGVLWFSLGSFGAE